MFKGGSVPMLDGTRTAKVTDNPEFTKYACKNYIIDDDKICDDNAEGYFLTEVWEENLKSIAIETTSINSTCPDPILKTP
jgi:hypothetical protein